MNQEINLIINLIIYLMLFSIGTFLFRRVIKENWVNITSNKKIFCSNMVFCHKAEAVAMFLQILMAILISNVIPRNTNQDLSNQILNTSMLAKVTMSVFLAPFVEEIVFRYIIFKSLFRKQKIAAYLITGLCFGMLHCLNGILIGDYAQLLLIIVYFIPAVVECYIYKVTDNIFYVIFMHMIWNMLATMARL